MYNLLLHLFAPATFRNEFGREMHAAFEHRLRDANPTARLWLWLEAIADLILAGLAAHFDLLAQDTRYLLRTARKSPGFPLIVIAVAALGVAAATSAFTIANHVYLRPLPFHEPDRIVRVWRDIRPVGYWRLETSPADYTAWQRLSRAFESIACYRLDSMNLSGAGEPQRLLVSGITHEFAQVLGVRAALGRTFAPAEDRPGAPGTVILSHKLWQREFAGSPTILGRTVLLDSVPYTVIGVMPADFLFPNREIQAWIAARFNNDDLADRGNYHVYAFARLKPGVTFDQAAAEMKVIGSEIGKASPTDPTTSTVYLTHLSDEMSDRNRTLLITVAAAAALLLLIACSNLANLLLAKAASRVREISVRAALGAGRERLVRQLLTESLILALAGGLLGVLLATWVAPSLTWLVPTGLPVSEKPVTDARVVAFALVITLITGAVFGVLPALRATRGVLGLRSGAGLRRERTRQFLVILQVAASLALMISTGVMARALMRINTVPVGFKTDHRLVFKTNLPFPKYLTTATRERYYNEVLTSLRGLPGVQSAAAVSFRPLGPFQGGIWPIRSGAETEGNLFACVRFVTPRYFETMGMPILQGRDFTPADQPASQMVAIASESFVKLRWPNETGLGRTFSVPFGNLSFTIVGVVPDIRFRGPEREAEPQFYATSAQMRNEAFVHFVPKDFVIAATSDPLALVPAIRGIVNRADPIQPISEIQTLDALLAGETATRRTQLLVVGLFAVAAIILAGVGIHGLLAFAVGQRTQEIGVRRALGAGTGEIVWMVLGEALLLGTAGAAAGTFVAYLANRAIESFLAGISPADVPTLALAAAVGITMTTAGALTPLLAALRVDPSVALRAE